MTIQDAIGHISTCTAKLIAYRWDAPLVGYSVEREQLVEYYRTEKNGRWIKCDSSCLSLNVEGITSAKWAVEVLE